MTEARTTALPPGTLKINELKAHPIAGIFGMMDEKSAGFLAIYEDIKANNLQQPIYMFEGMILEGRHRVRVLQLLGKEELQPYSQYRQYDGNDPVGFVLSMNLHRRHLNESQRALVAAKLANLEPGTNQHTKQGTSIDVASKLLNVGRASIDRAKVVLAKGDPWLVAAVENGHVAVSAAAAKAKGTPSAKAKPTGKKGKAKPSKTFMSYLELTMQALMEFDSYSHAEEYADKGHKQLDAVLKQIGDDMNAQNEKDAA